MFKALNKRLGKKGFTLIELIVVIAIIAILAVILIPRFTGFTDSANEKAAMSDARNILIAVQAMQLQDDTKAIAKSDVTAFTGTAFEGELIPASIPAPKTSATTCDDFVYIYNASGKWYRVEINDFVIDPEVTNSTTKPTA